jgi:hypothetical protein
MRNKLEIVIMLYVKVLGEVVIIKTVRTIYRMSRAKHEKAAEGQQKETY